MAFDPDQYTRTTRQHWEHSDRAFDPVGHKTRRDAVEPEAGRR